MRYTEDNSKWSPLLVVACAVLVSASAAAGDYEPCFRELVGCPDDGTTLFGQAPELDWWAAGLSDQPEGLGERRRYDSFSGLVAPIGGIRFWGLRFTVSYAGWVPCDEDPIEFEITFYEDDAGEPGAEVCSYDVTAAGTLVANVGSQLYEVYEYEALLSQPCELNAGWVSVLGGGAPDCWFLWLTAGDGDGVWHQSEFPFDLSLCLTTGGVALSGACCDDTTGVCAEGVSLADCAGRFIPDGVCADFDPPCGELVGACCLPSAGCVLTSYMLCEVTPLCPGDMNCDGQINQDDVDSFVTALWGRDYWTNPDCAWLNGDCNGDGLVNFGDINPFIGLLDTTCDATAGTWLGPDYTCVDCPMRTIALPCDLPVADVNATCGRQDSYHQTCLGAFDAGEDVLYELVVLSDSVAVEITLDPTEAPGSTCQTGLLISDHLPPDDDCLADSVHIFGCSPYGPGCVELAQGTYYVLIDSVEWGCMEEFELNITACEPAIGRCCYDEPLVCAELTAAECAALGGGWHAHLDCNTSCVAGDDCQHATVIGSLPFDDAFAVAPLQADGPAASCDKYGPGGLMQNDAWYVWTASADCLLTASASGGEDADAVLVVRDGCGELNELACADDGEREELGDEVVQFVATAGQTYYFQVGIAGNHPGEGWIVFSVDCASGRGACCFADGSCEVLYGTDCFNAGGQYQGDGTDCGSVECPQPSAGDTCADTIVVPLSAADPNFTDHNTTVGRGNDYDQTCLGSYDSGEDIVYELVVADRIAVSIMLEPGVIGGGPERLPYTGLLLADACPPGEHCIALSRDAGGHAHGFDCIALVPGTYYLMVDKWLTPPGIASFDLSITPCALPAMGACCVGGECVATNWQVECIALDGAWYEDEDCGSFTCPGGSGQSCDDPIVVNLSPGSETYDHYGETCGSGNHYEGVTCLDHDEGEDVIYKLVVTGGDVDLSIKLRDASIMAGMAVAEQCPPSADCVFGTYRIEHVHLPVGEHYLIVDTWAPPDCTDYYLLQIYPRSP